VPGAGGASAAGKKPALRDSRHDDDAPSRPSSKAGLYIGLGAAACVLFAGIGIVVGMSFLGDKTADSKSEPAPQVADSNKSSAPPSLVPPSTNTNKTPGPLVTASKPVEALPAVSPPASTESKPAAVASPSKAEDATKGPAVVSNPPPAPVAPVELNSNAPFDSGQVYKRLLKSATWVVLMTNGRVIGSGSGGLVDKANRLILTNHHVIEDVLARRCQAIVLFPEYDKNDNLISEQSLYVESIKKNQGLTAWVVHHDSKRDLALIQVSALPDRAMELPLAAKSCSVGDQVLSVGNPKATTLGTLWVLTTGSVRQVFHHKWRTGDPRGFVEHEANVVLTNSATNPGDSGGPLVNGRKQLVAVVHGGRLDANSLSTFIDVTEVRAFMNEYYKKNNLPLLPDQPEKSTEIASSSDINALSKHLTDASAATRAQAAKILGQNGNEARSAVSGLVAALKDPDVDVRRNAAVALEQIRSLKQSHLPNLMEAVKDSSPDVQIAAIAAIKTMGGEAEQAIPVLREALQAKEETVRKMAASALANFGPIAKAAVPDLQKALKDSSPSVRGEAVLALGKMGTDAAPAFKELGEAVRDNHLDVQLQALTAIANLGPEAAPLLPVLEKAFAIKNKDVRRQTMIAVGAIGRNAKDLVPRIIEAMDVLDLHEPARDALMKISKDGTDVITPLMKALGNRETNIRLGAVMTLAAFGPEAKKAVTALRGLAQSDKDPKIRVQATLAIVKINKKN
jgi:HEAT repeat protein/S1-C subfamily serine protease